MAELRSTDSAEEVEEVVIQIISLADSFGAAMGVGVGMGVGASVGAAGVGVATGRRQSNYCSDRIYMIGVLLFRTFWKLSISSERY